MARRTATDIERLQRCYASFEEGSAAEKLALLRRLERRRLGSPDEVLDLHERLLFLRAYPDDPEVLAQVERMLDRFSSRSDLRRHAKSLVNSGIAGTDICYPFYWFTIDWLVERWPDRLTIDWAEFSDNQKVLESRLPQLVSYAESLVVDETSFTLREWIERLRGPDETDAAFVARRFANKRIDAFLRESWYDELDIPCRLESGPGTPSRTTARYAPSRVVFQEGPLIRSRKAFRPTLEQPPRSVKSVPRREARALMALAREAMITRERDLDIFIHAEESDVRMIEFDDGLQFACFGATPEGRQMLDAVYGFVTLKNGVPAGYVLCSALFGSAEVAYNVFDAYRGSEAAYVFARALAAVRSLFAVDTFVLDPYQMGHDNMEGLESGAWWFYYKLGFRPKDPQTKRLVRAELRKIRARPGYFSDIDTLQELSATYSYLHLGSQRDDVIGIFSRENTGLRVMKYMARRFGGEREKGVRTCSEEVADILGVRSLSRFSRGERLAWARWSPLVRILPGLTRWSRADRSALVRVIRAKGGPRESDFVKLFDAHRRLRRAVVKLAESDPFDAGL